ncbi:MAG: hypothetical protein IPJ46_07880 [Anaerolineales bacterium]|nr:hypothetical protein [Anaerolineales bacterium]
MRKSTLFISAALTTFMLAVMFGVASAYQKIVQTGVATEAAQQQTQSQAQPVNTMITGTSSTVSGAMTIEQAADLASNVIGRTDLYAAENAKLNGVDAYMVTFSSGDLVYVGLDGNILSISKLPVTYIAGGQSTWVGSSGNSADNGGGSSTGMSSSSSNSNDNISNDNSSNTNDDHHDEDHDNDNGGEDEHDD